MVYLEKLRPILLLVDRHADAFHQPPVLHQSCGFAAACLCVFFASFKYVDQPPGSRPTHLEPVVEFDTLAPWHQDFILQHLPHSPHSAAQAEVPGLEHREVVNQAHAEQVRTSHHVLPLVALSHFAV